MSELNSSKQQSKTYKPLSEPCSTLKTGWEDLTFCKGGCDEITTLDKLCQACQCEYQDWRNENAGN